MVIGSKIAANLQLAWSDARKQRRPKETWAHYKMVELPDHCPALA
jgi:hypothetical protein